MEGKGPEPVTCAAFLQQVNQLFRRRTIQVVKEHIPLKNSLQVLLQLQLPEGTHSWFKTKQTKKKKPRANYAIVMGNSAAERKGQGENRGLENPFFPSWEPKWCDSLPRSMNKHRPCPKETCPWEPPKSLKHLGHCFVSFLGGVANTNTAFSSFLQGQKQPEESMISTVWCQSGTPRYLDLSY